MPEFRTRRRVLAVLGEAKPEYQLSWLPVAKCYWLELKRWRSSKFIFSGMTVVNKPFKRPSGYPYAMTAWE